ncbi:biotin transporter BioY [Murdochiella massiliensis]|uniref:biotin transporter BioY n=1 Tax=Murdochiella massiliensis TaxID=1673723 RepID=UPI00082F37F9|nr:biotin transporter BioY [Murdochiella massiliensis]
MNARRITRIAVMAALTFIGSLIRIPIGPIPITLQTVFVILTALLLQPADAALAMGVHFVLMLFLKGSAIFVSPSTGFLFGFILSAFLGSLITHRTAFGKTTAGMAFAVLVAAASCYIIGLPYMYYVLDVLKGADMNLMAVLEAGLIPFIPGDLIKAGIAFAVGKVALPHVEPLLKQA